MTRWAKYDSGNEGVATVDNYGHVTMHSFGEAPVTVWYQSHVTFSRLRIPFPYKLEEAVFKKAPRHNYIDDDILHHLEVLHIPPSPPATTPNLFAGPIWMPPAFCPLPQRSSNS